MSPGAEAPSNSLALTLARIKAQGEGSLSKIHQDLLNWHKNVDKRYAWVILMALFTMMTATLGPYRIYGLIYGKVTTENIYSREEASWPVSAIFTVENVIGPFVSIIIYHISYRQSMFIGGTLLALSNGLAYLSRSLWMDVLLIGVVQGIGYSFIFMPFMEIINNYFLKYRNIALGFALCGGTFSIFWWQPLFRWCLEAYDWRFSYLVLGMVGCLNILMVPLLRPNPMPNLDLLGSAQAPTKAANNIKKRSISMRALAYRNSIRHQSTITINKPGGNQIQRQASIISVNPFASSAGLERKISKAIASTRGVPEEERRSKPAKAPIKKEASMVSISNSDFCGESISLTEVGNESEFEWRIIWNVLKTPGFHLIWYNELIYFWVFSIYCLIMVDYGIDRGCSVEEAQSLLNYQSIGELLGRLFLTILVDLRFLSNRNWVVLSLMIMGSCLVAVTQFTDFIMMAAITVVMSSFGSLVYILLNGLLVDFLGEKQVTIGYGMASCIGGILMSFRPMAVGYFRDYHHTYDPLMVCLAVSCAIGALACLLEPLLSRCIGVKKPFEEANGNP